MDGEDGRFLKREASVKYLPSMIGRLKPPFNADLEQI
jgi:hypothetical protein